MTKSMRDIGNELARMVVVSAKEISEKMLVSPTLGIIQQDMSLLLDNFSVPIPASDYLVLEWTFQLEIPQLSRKVVIASPVNEEGNDMPGTSYSPLSRIDYQVAGPDIIQEIKIDFKKHLSPGDRVLVVLANEGNDHIVVGKVN